MKKQILIILLALTGSFFYQPSILAQLAAPVRITNTDDFTTIAKNSNIDLLLKIADENWYSDDVAPKIEDWKKMEAAKIDALKSLQGILDTDVIAQAQTSPTLESLLPKSTNGNNTDMLNIEKFLGTEEYSDAALAQKYMDYLNNLAPIAPLLNLNSLPHGELGVTLMFSAGEGTTTPLQFSKLSDNYNSFNKLQTALNNDPTYKAYLADRRSNIAARSLFLSNIVKAYNKRKILEGKTKSIARMEKEEIYTRLQGDYYSKIQSAAPATIQRETLLLLAKISQQLYEMQQTQERMLVMQSFNGLQNLKPTINTLNEQTLSRLIYCFLPENQATTTCRMASAMQQYR